MVQKAGSLIDVMNLFKPIALTGGQAAIYQKTAAARDGAVYEFHEGLYKQLISSDSYMRLLVVGHGGCGKSTELHMLEPKLTDNGTPVIFIEALDTLDLNNFTFVDLLMLIIEKLAQYAEARNININKSVISSFQKALSTKITQEYWGVGAELGADASVEISSPLALFLSVVAKITSSLKMASGLKEELRREIKPNIEAIIRSLNAFINDLRDKSKSRRPVAIILDGLEKSRRECIKRLFIDDSVFMSNIDAHFVVACPIAIYRSADAAVLSRYFTSDATIPMIKTHNQDGSMYGAGISVIKELVLKRADESYFESGVLEKIIIKTGGSLRDACYLISNSAFEADMKGRESIDMASVDFAIKKFAIKVFFRVNSSLYPRLKKIYGGNLMAVQDNELSELLYSEAVFEYNDDRWVDLHPLVRDYIDGRPGILD